MEEAYTALSTPEQFIESCRSSHKWQYGNLQLYLEPTETLMEPHYLYFSDDFDTRTIDPSWNWLDEFRDCSYELFSNLLDKIAYPDVRIGNWYLWDQSHPIVADHIGRLADFAGIAQEVLLSHIEMRRSV